MAYGGNPGPPCIISILVVHMVLHTLFNDCENTYLDTIWGSGHSDTLSTRSPRSNKGNSLLYEGNLRLDTGATRRHPKSELVSGDVERLEAGVFPTNHDLEYSLVPWLHSEKLLTTLPGILLVDRPTLDSSSSSCFNTTAACQRRDGTLRLTWGAAQVSHS